MTEFGVFNSEGCIEAGFYTLEAAESRAAEYRMAWLNDDASPIKSTVAGDPFAQAAEICPDHEEQSKDGCEDCAEEEEGEDDE